MRYLFLLLGVVIVSYGQILGMYVWQDDNALFFKLAHIVGPAGYLGSGLFGQGPYRYTAAFYYPIYRIFGFTTFPYFLFNLGLYFLATVCIYKVFAKIIGEKGGKIAGFLYAAGYIASDGFIRLFNSHLTSLSIILISLLFLSYWNYYRVKKIRWFLFSVLFFWSAIEFASARTHYLISVVILFELIFLTFQKPIKSILFSFVRLFPFILIFYEYFIRNADQRSGQVKTFVFSILKGNFQYLYSLVASWSNLVLPDWLMNKVLLIKIHFLWIFAPLAVILILVLLFRRNTKRWVLVPLFVVAVIVWTFISRSIFSTTLLNLSPQELFVTFCGGVLFILFIAGYFVLNGNKKLYLFLLSWAVLNVLAYSAYNPTVVYTSVNRYLAHSFLALVGILALISVNIKNKIATRYLLYLVIFWGVGNMLSSVIYQHEILKVRSDPPREFYTQLKGLMPVLKKGDIVYFDVADAMQGHFADAFSVAQMPEETALAWRYGLDRYDFKRFVDYPVFEKYMADNKIKLNQIHTFWYNNNMLTDTSGQVRSLLYSGSKFNKINFIQKDNTLVFDDPIDTSVPSNLILTLEATPSVPMSQSTNNKVEDNLTYRELCIKYVSEKNQILEDSLYLVSSQWQDRTVDKVHDNDINTVWQPDRVLWRNKNESLIIDLKKVVEIDRFVWINGFANNTPTEYYLDISNDQKNWETVKHVAGIRRIDSTNIQQVNFSPRHARFVRMRLVTSLNNDSPGIAEAWVVSTKFSGLNIVEAEEMAISPFRGLSSVSAFEKILNLLDFKGEVSIRWQSNKTDNWLSGVNQKINILYDGEIHDYQINLPAGGTETSLIELSDLMVPGKITVTGVTLSYPKVNE